MVEWTQEQRDQIMAALIAALSGKSVSVQFGDRQHSYTSQDISVLRALLAEADSALGLSSARGYRLATHSKGL